jgi:hypothetical protein
MKVEIILAENLSKFKTTHLNLKLMGMKSLFAILATRKYYDRLSTE